MLQKIRYDKVDKILFQGTLSNGLKVIGAPVPNSKKSRIGINLSIGGYAREYYIGTTRIYPGTLTVLKEVLKRHHSPKADKLFDGGCEFNVSIYESYTSFEVTADNEVILDYVDHLLSLLDEFNVDNDQVENLKRTIKVSEGITDDDILRDKLYLTSPMGVNPNGTLTDIKNVHLVALKKFFNSFIIPDYFTLFAVGNLDFVKLEEVASTHVFPSHTQIQAATTKPSKENYTIVKQKLGVAQEENSLVLGVKFEDRKSLFEAFGNDLFPYYLLLQKGVISMNNTRLTSSVTCLDEIVSSTIHEGGEDAYLEVVFKTSNPEQLQVELDKYFTFDHLISRRDFKLAKKRILNEMKLVYKDDAITYYNRLLNTFANSFSDTALIESSVRTPYSKMNKFLAKFVTFPRTYLSKKK